MKNYKSLITGSLIAAFIISTPIAIFAEGNNKNGNNNENKAKVEQTSNKKLNNSFFNKMAGWFGNKHADAKTANINLTPSIRGITAPTVLKAGEVGTWIINASDPQNGTLSYGVDWGDANILAKSFSMLSQPVFVQTSTFTHSYANKGEYKITFTATNTAGQKTTSSVTVHITEAQNIVAPVISNVTAVATKSDKATINWTTDVRSNTVVWFNTTSPVDTTINKNVSRRANVLNHNINLKNLEPNTKYYAVVASTNKAGTTKSGEVSFTTPAVVVDNSSAPVITSLTGAETIIVGATETVTINATNHNNGALSYTANWGDTNVIVNSLLSVVAQPVYVQSATLSHIYNTVGVYNAIFTVENSNGIKTSSTKTITVTPIVIDTTVPVISNVITTINASNVTIAWTTNEPATSSIFYSVNTPVDTKLSTTPSVVDTTLVTKHSMTIPSLTSSTLYHFILKSADAANNVTLSTESLFTTN
jgi:hypothetical protein